MKEKESVEIITSQPLRGTENTSEIIKKVNVKLISKKVKVILISKKVKVLIEEITSQPLRGTENTRSPPLLAASALCNSKL